MSTNPQSPPHVAPKIQRIAVTGAAGLLGEHLITQLVADTTVESIVAIDRAGASSIRSSKVTNLVADLSTANLDQHLAGVDTVIHLAFDGDPSLSHQETHRANVGGTSNLLASATRTGVAHVVLVSSATVYGAWANNALPLSEDSLMRPNSDFEFAVQKAQIEHLVDTWLTTNPKRTASVLRPTMVTAHGYPGGLSRTLRPGVILRAGVESPSRQYLHLDDLVSAVVVCSQSQADGIFNVAPDGWVSGEVARSLGGRAPLPKLPGWLATRVSAIEDRLNSNPSVPGMEAFELHPWVVANDRLKGLGWHCQYSNEEALVVGTDPRRWSTLTANGKQQIVTAAGAIALIGVGGVVRSLAGRHRSTR